MIDCCGYSFCHTCIKIVKYSEKPCPLCNGTFTIYPDKRLSRTLKAMRVCCTHSKSGCDWKGELGMIDEHLNFDLSPDKKTIGCVYTKVHCDYCSVWVERRNIVHHQFKACSKRPFSCDYCHEYESFCEDVTVNHWPVCPCRPVSCPNECGIYPEKRNVQQHLCNECQMASVTCQFSYCGCETIVLRKDIQDHMMKNVATHLSLQSQHYRDCFIQLESKLEVCEEKIASLEKENAKLKKNYEEMVADLKEDNATLKSTLQLVQHEMNTIKINGTLMNMSTQHPVAITNHDSKANLKENRFYSEELEELKSLVCIAPLQFTIHAVSMLQRNKLKWLSAPFYSHPQGYKMCLKVYPNGHSTSAGSDISLYVCIMKGHYDDHLKWPFRGSVTVQLVDQAHSLDHVTQTVAFHQNVNQEFSGRVIEGEVSGGWGILKFVSLKELVPKYIQNDSLQIRVDKIVM